MNTSLLISLFLAGVALTGHAAAQIATDQMESNGRRSLGQPISGVVTSSNRLAVGLLRIQMVEAASARIVCDVQMGIQGNFDLPAQPIGFYELRVVGSTGEIRYTQDIHNSTTGYLSIVLGGKKQTGGAKLISAARLEHKTTKRAKKEVGEAMKAFESGRRQDAIRHLEAAAIDDPECFDALSNLGALFLQEREADRAIEWLERAYRIDPTDALNNTNLSAYHAFKDDYEKSQHFAEASLRSDPSSARARYMLAFSLVRQGKELASARQHLEEIQCVFGPARNLLLSLTMKQ